MATRPVEHCLIECVIPGCSHDFEGSIAAAVRKGWRKIKPSDRPPPNTKEPRSHLGWCPEHAEQFSVEK